MHVPTSASLPPKRLIEVDFPVARVSAHARREKSGRIGSPSRLHVWWARKPLASCRAVTCAALWPDPADPSCPAEFRLGARPVVEEWLRTAGEAGLLAPESRAWLARLEKAPATLEDPGELRRALLDFVADFADPLHASLEEFVGPARRLTALACQALSAGERFRMVDPFAGGGSIPLEGLRLGCEAVAADLNPVAVILERVLLEYLPRYRDRLVEEVHRWGQWMARRLRADMARFYPADEDGAVPLAWLWSRTVRCEECGAEVPTRYSPWLAHTPRKSVALRTVPRADGQGVDFEMVENPRPKQVEAATVSFSRVTCPCCGHTTPGRQVRAQLKARRGGTADARLIAVVTVHPSRPGRRYRLATPADLTGVEAAAAALAARTAAHQGELSPVPDEPSPAGGGKGAGRAFAQRNHGLDTFGDFFTTRQALTLDCLVRAVRSVGDHLKLAPEVPPDLAVAVQTVLSLAVTRQADFGNSLNRWEPASESVKQLFARHTMALVWDFAEANPIDEDLGTFWKAIRGVEKALEDLGGGWSEGRVVQGSATALDLADGTMDMVFTDPPHYDNVPYADLSDFFYVWLRRAIGPLHPDLFATILTPKADECLLDQGQGKDHAWFEGLMGRAMAESRRVLAPDGIGVVIFAHKSSGAWEGQIQALVDAGWMVTAAWPLDTELTSRLRAHASAVLASTLHLVCRHRPRSTDGGPGTSAGWDVVSAEIVSRLREWFPKMDSQKVAGEDAVFACLGPALEVYSRYDRVLREDGSPVSVGELLEFLWAVLSGETA